MLTDVDGIKMSKSLGNIIRPQELTEKYGADTLRFYMSRTKAGNDINFSWLEAELAYKNLMILWNVHKLIINYSGELKVKPELIGSIENLDKSAKYIMSRLHSTLKKVTEYFDNYNIDLISQEIESLFLELSRTYIQLNRENMVLGDEKTKKKILDVMFTVLYDIIKMLAPVCPFISEQIYQNFKESGFVNEESIHLEFWDKFDDRFIDQEFEKSFSLAMTVVEAGLSARDRLQIGVRWPLSELIIDTDKKELVIGFEDIIKKQLNIKKITFNAPEFEIEVSPNFREIGSTYGTETGDVLTAIKNKNEDIAKCFKKNEDYHLNINNKEFILKQEMFNITKICKDYELSESKHGTVYLDKKMTPELEKEGFAREITRRIQSLRKKAEMNKSDIIILYLELPVDLDIKEFENNLKIKVGAESIIYSSVAACKFKSAEKIKGKEIKIGFNKK